MVKLTVPVSPPGPGGSPAPPRGAPGRGPGGGLRDPPSPFPPSPPSPSWPAALSLSWSAGAAAICAGPVPGSIPVVSAATAVVVVLAGEPVVLAGERVVLAGERAVVLAGEQGVERPAGEQGEEHPRAELLQRAVGAGVLQVAGGGVDVLVGGEHGGGRQVAAGEGPGPGGLGPAFDPGVFLRLLPPLAGGTGVEGEHGAVQHAAQLPGRQPRRVRGDERGDGGGPDIAEAGQLAGEDDRLRQVDPPGRQRRGHGRQPHHRGGEADQPVRRPAGQRQGRGDLITDMISQPPVSRRAGVRGPPGTQPGHRGQLQRGGPRRQPPGRGQDPDQLIVAEHGQPVIPCIAGEGGQRRAGCQLIELPPGGEP